MKRYEHFCSYDGGGPADPEEMPAGDWVRYEDAQAEIARLRGALADIGASADMTLEIARSKAMRVYHETADAAMKEAP